MQIGKLRSKINILRPSTAQDTFGGLQSATTFASNVWASINTLMGKELLAAQQAVAEVTHDIEIRYMPGVKSNMLVQYGTRTFQILTVTNPHELNENLHVMCVERDDG